MTSTFKTYQGAVAREIATTLLRESNQGLLSLKDGYELNVGDYLAVTLGGENEHLWNEFSGHVFH